MTKRIKITIIVFAALLAAVFVFNFLWRQTYMTSDVDTGFYVDRSSIIEPTLQIGKYCINGDKNGCFFEIMPDSTICLNGSSEQIWELFKNKYPYYDEAVGEKKAELDESLNADIEFWKAAHEYYVYTDPYPNGEKETKVAVKWTDTDGNESFKLIRYIDSETLGFYEDFILTE